MKELFFLNSFAGGGAERVCLNLASQLYKMHIESDFVTVYNKNSDYDIPSYVHVFPLGIEDKPLACLKIIKEIPRVNAFLSNSEYVLITAHVQPSQFLAALTSVRKRCLYVMHKSSHRIDEKSSWLGRVSMKLFFKARKIVTVSRGIEKELKEEYGISIKNLVTIYNPCTVEPSNKENNSKSLNKRPYILVMGRLVEQKNPLLALELYYQGRFYLNYDLVYLGQGPIKSDLKRQIEKYELSKYVFLVGFQKNPRPWLLKASLLLSCSNQEGLPMNMIEALLCGTPVVAADCPYGPSEILIDELANYLIYPEKEFEKSILTISSALKSYPEITEKYYEKFDSELITKTYLKVWRECFVQNGKDFVE